MIKAGPAGWPAVRAVWPGRASRRLVAGLVRTLAATERHLSVPVLAGNFAPTMMSWMTEGLARVSGRGGGGGVRLDDCPVKILAFVVYQNRTLNWVNGSRLLTNQTSSRWLLRDQSCAQITEGLGSWVVRQMGSSSLLVWPIMINFIHQKVEKKST